MPAAIYVILALLAGLIAGFAFGHLLTKSAAMAPQARILAARDVLQAQLAMAREQLATQKDDYEQRLTLQGEAHARQMEQQMSLIREQMNTAAEQILREREQQLTTANAQQLAAILMPLRENIRQMREAVERSDREQTTTMERLDASIKENLRQARQVGERADTLARALTSDNKTQGNFGELRLRQLLDEMGLQRGLQYEEQTMLRDDHGRPLTDDEGHKLIPDVVLHFPDERDVVIDSKVSLKAFEDYFSAATDDEKQSALRRHVMSVKSHVQELAHKDYSHYTRKGRQRLDFVMMYIFSESALQLALSAEPRLWRDAYDQGVVIAGSQSLFVMLRVLELSWRHMRQAENQEEIMRQASTIVDRVQQFYERFLKADEQLHRTQEAFDELRRSAAPNGQSITTAATHLLKYGAQENPKRRQRLPKGDDESPALP